MARPSERSATSALPHPSAAEVRAHLETLLHDEALAISERNRRFLAYIVEETLAGRGDRIKAYNVALTAFDRTDDFDPQTDPIVRIEASRLRRALEHYYLTAGKHDPLRIEVPKGSYVAVFSYAELAPSSARIDRECPRHAEPAPQIVQPRRMPPLRKSPVWWIAGTAATLLVVLAWLMPGLVRAAAGPPSIGTSGSTVLVLPFDVGAGEGQAFVARGITAELIGRLRLRDGLAVLGKVPAGSGAAANPDYVLAGSATAVGSRIYISAALADERTGRYLWSWNAERALDNADLLRIEAAIAGEIVEGIQPLLPVTTQ